MSRLVIYNIPEQLKFKIKRIAENKGITVNEMLMPIVKKVSQDEYQVKPKSKLERIELCPNKELSDKLKSKAKKSKMFVYEILIDEIEDFVNQQPPHLLREPWDY